MKNIAPDIIRKRLLIEGYYSIQITEETLKSFLILLTKELSLKIYADPIVYAPESGMGKESNAGFDAFVPLIDSGISAYIWTNAKFFSILLYTCKDFDESRAIDFTSGYMDAQGEIVHMLF